MTPKKILIATPLKGQIPTSYFQNSLKLAVEHLPGIKLDWCLLEGPAVHQARNELVAHARRNQFDELVFWDKDLLCEQEGKDVTSGAMIRLLSHNVDMVCGIYGTRSLKTHWHGHLIADEKPDQDGLQKVSRSALGFSKIKMSVFKRIEERNPWRKGVLVDPNHPPHAMTEFFPMGLKGPDTPEARLNSILEALEQPAKSPEIMVQRIQRLATIPYDQPNVFVSEDYWFCDLARSAGIDIHLDTNLVLSHLGTIAFPIETPELLEILSEPWRKDEIRSIREQLLKSKASKTCEQATHPAN